LTQLPNFFLIGAHKAGTTSISMLLAAHPQIAVARPKEPGFFARDRVYAKGRGWYAGCFDHAVGSRAIGDCSTIYSQCGVFPQPAARIAAVAPAARILYVGRHPLERVASAWVQYRAQGRPDVPADFSAAVRSVPQLLDATLYWKQLSRYRERFPDQRILALTFDDFVADPVGVMRRAYRFLGVDPDFVPAAASWAYNASAGQREPTAILTLLRKLRSYGPFRLPAGATTRMRRWTTRPLRYPAFDADTREWVLERVGNDNAQFLRYVDARPDLWSRPGNAWGAS